MSGEEVLPGAQVAHQRRQYVIGLILLLIVVLEWTGSNFLTQDLFEDGYNKPFFVTYMNTASFSIYLIPAFLKYLGQKRFGEKHENEQGYQALVDEDEEPQLGQDCTSPDGSEPLTTQDTIKLAAIFCLFWFLANWTVNASLEFTSVASTTILASMSGFFTLLIGRMFHVEALSVEKIGAVIVSFVGCTLVSLADTSAKAPAQPPTEIPVPPGSDLLALGSALFYALYVVLLKVRIGDESRINMQLFFGFVGIFNVLACWPIGIILHLTGAETFEWPVSRKAWYAVLLNMFITLSSDFIYVLAMLKTTPLVVTIGLSLTIPLAVGGDLFLGKSTSAQSLIGATLVLIAFIVVGLEDRDAAPVVPVSHLEASSSSEEDTRGRSAERPTEFRDVPLLSQSEDDENLRRSVEAMLSRDRTRRRGSRAMDPDETDGGRKANQERGPLDRGRSRTRSGTFKRERVSGSLRRSEERRTRSRAGRKSSSDQDDKSRQSATLAGGSLYWFRPTTKCEEEDVPQPSSTPIKKDRSQDSLFSSDGVSSWSLAGSLLTWVWPESLGWLQNQIRVLVLELSRGPGSLWNEIVESPPDTVDHPEYDWEADVRLGDETCLPEKAFLRNRKRRMRAAFAELFDVPIAEIDERDLPIVAIAGSGGGYRAMVNSLGALQAAEETGILNCTSYVAGISGSCWALAMLYSGVAGSPSPSQVRQHLISRIQTPYLDASTLDILITPPTKKYLLSGFLHKATAPGWGGISLTDIYGTLVSARLLVPDNLDTLDSRCLSVHQFRRFVDDGSCPMPILTAVSRHLREPLEKQEVETKKQESKTYGPTRRLRLRKEAEELEAQARWLWFEWSPYEVGCDELGAWIPSWALGRRFDNGRNIERRYFLEVQPLLRDLPLPIFDWLEGVLIEKEKEFDVIHPVPPVALPNFVQGLEGQLRYGSPEGITEAETLRFMDAGAELNIPYYPFLRREVDCIIALDASADSQAVNLISITIKDLWFTRAEEYAARRGLQTWPKGARWPKVLRPSTEEPSLSTQQVQEVADSASKANERIASTKEADVVEQASHQQATQAPMEGTSITKSQDSLSNNVPGEAGSQLEGKSSPHSGIVPDDEPENDGKPSSAYVWIGSSTDTGPSRADELSEEDLASRDGIGIVYMPLIPNEEAHRRHGGHLWDPMNISTWRFELQREETDKLLTTAEGVELSDEL
ncbi:hypothetical protein FRC07_005004 [Ceratobasidium sp. 392]|nr:hypothetical protein FRC07_005004 [Ceratobasidium sp. 392]